MWTLILVIIAYLIGIIVPTIGDAMTILGATTNSGIGFIIPTIFYMKIQKNKENSKMDKHIICCYAVIIFICCSSVITLYSFIVHKITGK